MKKLFAWITDFFSKIGDKKIFGHPLDDILWKTVIVCLLIASIVYMLPSERAFEYGNLNIGSVSGEEIIAPFTFPIIKSDNVLKREREQA